MCAPTAQRPSSPATARFIRRRSEAAGCKAAGDARTPDASPRQPHSDCVCSHCTMLGQVPHPAPDTCMATLQIRTEPAPNHAYTTMKASCCHRNSSCKSTPLLAGRASAGDSALCAEDGPREWTAEQCMMLANFGGASSKALFAPACGWRAAHQSERAALQRPALPAGSPRCKKARLEKWQ